MIPEGSVQIRILIEHKSDYDANLWFQLMNTILVSWKKTGYCPVIPIVLHTGPSPFQFASPQVALASAAAPIVAALPLLPIFPIDFATSSVERIMESTNLDAVAKVILRIMKLAQLEKLDVASVRSVIREHFPEEPTHVQRRYLNAAISYINFKVPLERDSFDKLRFDMALAHPIHPDSLFAQDLRAELAKGMTMGITQGIIEGQELKQIETIQAMLANGLDWSLIQAITHLDQNAYEALKAKHPTKG